MTELHFRDVAGRKAREPMRLPPRRRRLSTFARHAPKSRPFMLSVHREGDLIALNDQTVRLRRKWKDTLIGPRDAVLVTLLPLGGGASSGGGGGGKATGAAIGIGIASIALAVAAPYLIPLLATALPVGLAAAAPAIYAGVTAGIVAGASYLLSRATKAKANATDTRPSYGITGGGNLPRPSDRIPRGYGRCWMEPDLTQPDYSTYSSDAFGDHQTLYKRMTLGVGRYQIHTIKAGDAVIWDETHGMHAPYSNGGQIEIIEPGAVSSLVPSTVISSDQVTGQLLTRPDQSDGWSGPFPVTPAGIETTRIVCNISFPQGVYGVFTSKGRNVGAFWGFVFQYAAIDDGDNVVGDWNYLPNGVQSNFLLTTRAFRLSITADLPLGRYAVRAQNQTGFAQLFDGAGTQIIFNDMTWDALEAWQSATITRPGITEIAVVMRAGPTIGLSAIASLMVEATSILPVWNGAVWQDMATTKAVWAYADVLRNPDYGAALDDSRIDLARLLYYDTLALAFESFNAVIRGPVSVFAAGTTILGAIQAQPILIGGIWSMVRDEQHATKRHVITRRQIAKGSTSTGYDTSKDDGSADVIVEYNLDGDPRKQREVRKTFGSLTNTPARVAATGVTSDDHAVFQATWIAACNYYRRRKRNVSIEHEGRMLVFGDPAAIDAWYLSKGAAAGVESVAGDGLTLTLDTDVSPVLALGTSVATFRDRAGREWGPVQVTQGAAGDVVVMDAADVAAAAGDAGVSFASIQRGAAQEPMTALIANLVEVEQRWIIRSVQPQGNRYAVEAVEDNPAVWAALGETIITNPDIPSIPVAQPVTPVVPWISAQCIQKSTTIAMDWAVGKARGAAQYLIAISYDGGTSSEPVSSDASTSGTYMLKTVDPATSVIVTAHAVGITGIVGPTVQTTFLTFKPSIDDQVASLLVLISDLEAQVRRDIASIAEIGKGTLRDTVKLLSDQLQALADAAATESANNYDQRALIKAASGKNFAAIQTETIARVSADEAQASVSTALAARLTTAEGNITGTSTALSNLTTRVTTAEGNITASASAITALQSTVNDPTHGVAATATAVSSLNTSVSSINGTLSAQATSISTLSTTVAGHTSTLTTYGSSINGISLKYGVVGTIDGVSGGFVLTGAQQTGGGAVYTLEVEGDLVVDGTISGTKLQAVNIIAASAQIGNLVVGTSNIANNAVTSGASVFTSAVDASVTLNVSSSASTVVFMFFNGGDQGGGAGAVYTFYIDGVAVNSVLGVSIYSGTGTTYFAIATAFGWSGSLSAGSHTFRVSLAGYSAGGSGFTLIAQEFKK